MEATCSALLALSTIAAQTAASGRLALGPVSALAACTSTVPTSGQSTAAIRPSDSRFVASPSSILN